MRDCSVESLNLLISQSPNLYQTLIRRLLILPLILLLTSVAIFLLPYLAGIDPTLSIIRARIGERTVDPAAVEQLRND